MDRKPLPPPFPVGTRLRYLRDVGAWVREDGSVILGKGTEVEIVRVTEGRRGTGRVLFVDEDDGEEIRDLTKDGYSVFTLPEIPSGRIIWPANAHEWEVL